MDANAEGGGLLLAQISLSGGVGDSKPVICLSAEQVLRSWQMDRLMRMCWVNGLSCSEKIFWPVWSMRIGGGLQAAQGVGFAAYMRFVCYGR